jgi:hypothetical protein
MSEDDIDEKKEVEQFMSKDNGLQNADGESISPLVLSDSSCSHCHLLPAKII